MTGFPRPPAYNGDEVRALTVVYIDRVLALNLAVDYLLLLTTATLAGAPLRRLRLGLCALGGGVYAALVFVLPVLTHPLWKALAGTALALCAFGRERRPWRMVALFWLLSGALAGLLLALGLMVGAPGAVLQRVYRADVSAPVLLGAAAVFYALLHLVFRQGARYEGGEVMEIDVVIGGRACRLRALRDNGNSLRDPVRGQPVLVVEAEALQPLWPEAAAAILSSGAPPEEKMSRLYRAGINLPFVLMPFQAVGTESGLLLACRSDHIRVGGRRMKHVFVALADTRVGDGGYQALWGGREKGGSNEALASACTVDQTADQAG